MMLQTPLHSSSPPNLHTICIGNTNLKPSYISLLQTCSKDRCLQGGLQLQADMIKRGLFESNGFLQSYLMNMYVQCGSLVYARKIFDIGEVKASLISWNSLITMYCQSGLVEDALLVFLQLQMYGIEPDHFTLSVLIGAIEQCYEFSLGRQMQSLAIKLGYGQEEFVANSLIQMYAASGAICESLKVFNGIAEAGSSVSWNSMIARLVETGLHEDALFLYNQMKHNAVQATPPTFSSLLKVCASLGANSEGEQVHGQAIVCGFIPNMILETALIDCYGKCGEIEKGRQVFDEMEFKNVVSWNSMIRGYSLMGHGEEAMQLFQLMRRADIIPDKFTFPALLNGTTNEFESIHGHIIKVGLETDCFVGTSLIAAYSTKQSIKDAARVFDDTDSKDIGVWSSIIAAYVKSENAEESFKLFAKMLDLGIMPNQFIYSNLFTVCSDLSTLEIGKQVHARGIKGSESFDVATENSLITMYSNCGCIAEAWRLFDSLETPNVISYNSMISALGQHGFPNRATELFRRMTLVGLLPDEITLLNLLSAYNHSGLIDRGLELFNFMEDEYGIKPRYQHYTCIADMLARAGQIEEALRIIHDMPFDPEPDLWRVMLGSCGKHQEMKIGKQVAELLLQMDPQNATNYILLANVYARSGRWGEAEQVRHLMNEKSTKREPAISWIEINRRIHTFRAEDRSHPLSKEIYEELQELIRDIKVAGYKPDISYTVHDIEEDRREESLFHHSEKLAFTFGLLSTARGVTLRIMKNLRVCGDCHNAFKHFSMITGREIVLRDNYRFHHFSGGMCSCGDYW